ncbi:MAG: HlyD family efflux transporter periplasmic adaptor subunit [Bacillota bacterium]|nr:HlyD family efflux transporter periplasmic adaptor subunit [Bacillota bacterium]MDW7676456.1 HlyD family efflux transporter periplasmic adaptor subunit [Bacillota bacterium]
MNQSGRWKMVIGIVAAVPIILVIGLYIFFRMSPLISQIKVEVMLAEYGTLEETIPVKGIVVRQESLYPIPADGSVRWTIQAGQKTAKQQKLAEILVSDEDQSLLLQQQLIAMRLETLASGGDLSVYSLEAMQEIDQQMTYLMTDIRHNVKNEQYELAFQNQQMLQEMAEQKQLVSVHQHLPEMSVEELEQQQDLIENQLNHLTHEVRAPEAGILGIGSDGLEEGFPLIYSDEENPELIKQIIKYAMSDDHLEPEAGYYRIIQEHRWHLYLVAGEELSEAYEPDQRLMIRDPATGKEVRGRFVTQLASPDNEEIILLIELNEELAEWYQKRQYSLEVIRQRQEGLIISKTAVMVDELGNQSVFRLDVNGYAVRTPVRELGRNESVAVLSMGPLTVTMADAEGDEQQVQTIRQYDEIVTNPEIVIEGQRIR